jgi:hypothetical protein
MHLKHENRGEPLHCHCKRSKAIFASGSILFFTLPRHPRYQWKKRAKLHLGGDIAFADPHNNFRLQLRLGV